MKLIDKDVVLAEIEKLKGKISDSSSYCNGWQHALRMLELSLNSLEVKEVDYDKEVTEYLNNFENANIGRRLSLRRCAKHFFQLGLNASNSLTWEDMMLIHKCCKDAMNSNLNAWQTAEGQQKIYEDVLKRFKAQKGE